VSAKAIAWALNIAPVPADASGKPNTACAFVLVALASYAAPDGTAAFPAARVLARCTRLSERTVRTSLDRLEAEGVIALGDPAAGAAWISRGDRRPQVWNLSLGYVRGDLTDADIAELEPGWPGLRQRAAAIRRAAGNGDA
jgi:hypothetical protein